MLDVNINILDLYTQAIQIREERITTLKTYYISPTGNDRNSGTSPKNAWKSLSKINSLALNAGDQVLLQGGYIYSGNLYFSKKDSGTSSAPIKISSYGTGTATIMAGTGTGIYIYDAAGYDISNLKIVGSGVSTNGNNGINVYNDLAGNIKLDTITINNVDVSGFKNYGIAIGGWNQQSGFRNVKVTNVLVHDNGKGGLETYAQLLNTNENVYIGYVQAYNNLGIAGQTQATGNGIVLGGVNVGTIERSIAHNNGGLDNYPAGPGAIWTYDSTNIVIQYNEAYNNHTGYTGEGDGVGFDLDQNVSDSLMQYNYSHGNDGAGFLLCQQPNNSNHTDNIVRYNISENDSRKMSSGGIYVYGYVRNAEIYNNTVFLDTGLSGTPSAAHIQHPVNSVHFRNNIFQSKNGVKLIEAASGSTDLLFQGNDYYSTGSTFKINWNGTTYNSLDSWRTATDQEKLGTQNLGMSVDPLFNNPGSGTIINNPALLNTLNSYHLGSTSPLISKGLNLNQLFGINPGTQDFKGTFLPLGLGYDIGADESF